MNNERPFNGLVCWDQLGRRVSFKSNTGGFSIHRFVSGIEFRQKVASLWGYIGTSLLRYQNFKMQFIALL